MHKKAVITFVLVFLLMVSIVSAADTTTSSSSCTGFWGSIKCFIFGDVAKRTAVGGKAWWDGSDRNVAGKADASKELVGITPANTKVYDCYNGRYCVVIAGGVQILLSNTVIKDTDGTLRYIGGSGYQDSSYSGNYQNYFNTLQKSKADMEPFPNDYFKVSEVKIVDDTHIFTENLAFELTPSTPGEPPTLKKLPPGKYTVTTITSSFPQTSSTEEYLVTDVGYIKGSSLSDKYFLATSSDGTSRLYDTSGNPITNKNIIVTGNQGGALSVLVIDNTGRIKTITPSGDEIIGEFPAAQGGTEIYLYSPSTGKVRNAEGAPVNGKIAEIPSSGEATIRTLTEAIVDGKKYYFNPDTKKVYDENTGEIKGVALKGVDKEGTPTFEANEGYTLPKSGLEAVLVNPKTTPPPAAPAKKAIASVSDDGATITIPQADGQGSYTYDLLKAKFWFWEKNVDLPIYQEAASQDKYVFLDGAWVMVGHAKDDPTWTFVKEDGTLTNDPSEAKRSEHLSPDVVMVRPDGIPVKVTAHAPVSPPPARTETEPKPSPIISDETMEGLIIGAERNGLAQDVQQRIDDKVTAFEKCTASYTCDKEKGEALITHNQAYILYNVAVEYADKKVATAQAVLDKMDKDDPDEGFAQSALDAAIKERDELQDKADEYGAKGNIFGDIEKARTQGWLKWYSDAEFYLAGVGAVSRELGKLGKYPGLSNLLFPDTTQAWNKWANNEFFNTWADIPGRLAREACEYDQKKRAERPGEGISFIHTPTGAYQFVGSIQAEKSTKLVPILCEKNPNEEAAEQFICPKTMVCVNGLCYKGSDPEDIDPDVVQPEKANLYKIHWGVSAPADLAWTPFVDENGIAVRFNLGLYKSASQSPSSPDKWVFKKQGSTSTSVIELKNGAQDGGTIVKYLAEEYVRACVVFNPDYKVKDDEGDYVSQICANFKSMDETAVEYGASGAASSLSTTSTSPEVEFNI